MTQQTIERPAGLATARFIKALAIGGGHVLNAAAYAEGQRARWEHQSPAVFLMTKTAVAAATSAGTPLSAARTTYRDYIPLLRPRTLVDRIPGLRYTPENTSVLRLTGSVAGGVIAEGAPIPVNAVSLERVTLPGKKIGALIVTTVELMRAEARGPSETQIATELAAALGAASDAAMFSLSVSGSIAAGGIIIPSTGSTLAAIDADLARMFGYFSATDAALDRAVFVMSATTAAYLGLLRGSGGALAFNGTIGARGGSLLGVPVFVSGALTGAGSPQSSQITLLDPSQVLVADPEAVEVTTSQEGAIEMLDNPTNNATTPTATTLVSVYETNSVGVRGLRWIDWALGNANACVTMSTTY